MTPEERLTTKGLTLPEAPPPVGSYVPCVQVEDVLYVSGQLPMRDGRLIAVGQVTGEVAIERAGEAAVQATLNALAQVAAHAGSLSRVARIVRLGVYVSSSPGFTGQSDVANAASDLLYELFDEAGRHARAAIGVSSLPKNAPVELELIVQIRR